MDHFLLFLSCVCYAFACLFIDALWSPAGKGLASWLSFVMSNCVFVTFPFKHQILNFSIYLIENNQKVRKRARSGIDTIKYHIFG